jgi:hypothetical protein
MLDRASLHALARQPERNDPMLNVALAEEGDIAVLSALAECPSVGPEALARIETRIEAEGESVGHAEDPPIEDDRRRGSRRAEDEEPTPSNGSELDAKLIVHPRADDRVRDSVLDRHAADPFFVLAAAAHRHATARAIDLVARWPAATPLHDRTWLALIDPHAPSPMTIATWAADDEDLPREAAARLGADPSLLEVLGRDGSRRVRRAVAGNSHTEPLVIERLRSDPACEVRARAAAVDGRAPEPAREAESVDLGSARFRAAVAAMHTGGTLAADVVRALRAGPLDEEGACLAARALDGATVAELVGSRSHPVEIDLALAAGIAFRCDLDGSEDRDAALLAQCVRTLADADKTGSILTGKGRLASWLADGVLRTAVGSRDELVQALGKRTLAGDRMVLGRVTRARGEQSDEDGVAEICSRALARHASLPIALLEVAWRTGGVTDDVVAELAAQVRPASADGSLEQEVDLDPRARSLALLERVASALVGKAPLSPRAALALVALEPRRIRYILSALPQWKGVLTGANVARVLKAHAGALSAAGPSGQRKPTQAAASWTQRRLDEVELAVALAVGDISPSEALTRLVTGYATLTQGPALAAGMEARATLDGMAIMEPLVEHLAKERSRSGAALATWLLVEGLDRVRSPTGIAAALDAPWVTPPAAGASSRSMVPLGLSEALATLERRSPGRLPAAMPQTPRGRAALASGIARAYRALGGMAVEES